MRSVQTDPLSVRGLDDSVSNTTLYIPSKLCAISASAFGISYSDDALLEDQAPQRCGECDLRENLNDDHHRPIRRLISSRVPLLRGFQQLGYAKVE